MDIYSVYVIDFSRIHPFVIAFEVQDGCIGVIHQFVVLVLQDLKGIGFIIH